MKKSLEALFNHAKLQKSFFAVNGYKRKLISVNKELKKRIEHIEQKLTYEKGAYEDSYVQKFKSDYQNLVDVASDQKKIAAINGAIDNIRVVHADALYEIAGGNTTRNDNWSDVDIQSLACKLDLGIYDIKQALAISTDWYRRREMWRFSVRYNPITNYCRIFILLWSIRLKNFAGRIEESPETLEFLANNILTNDPEWNFYRTTMMLNAIVGNNQEQLLSWVNRTSDEDIEKLSVSLIANQLMPFFRTRFKKAVADSIHEKFYTNCSDRDTMTLKSLDHGHLYDDKSKEMLHENLPAQIDMLLKHDSMKEDVKLYSSLLENVTANKTVLMNCRYDADQLFQLQEMIFKAIDEAKPLSLIRLGDGEAYPFFSDIHAADIPEEAAILEGRFQGKESYWWNCILDSKLRNEISVKAKTAIGNCDVLGIPSFFRIARDITADQKQLQEQINTHDFLTLMEGLNAMAGQLRSSTIVEERIHHPLFTREYIIEASRRADNVVVLGCWKEKKYAGKPFGANVQYIKVNSEVRVADKFTLEKPLCFELAGVSQQVIKHCKPGTLFLCGAGLIGKIFIDVAKSQGAVALDVGSVLDGFAGYKTRPNSQGKFE